MMQEFDSLESARVWMNKMKRGKLVASLGRWSARQQDMASPRPPPTASAGQRPKLVLKRTSADAATGNRGLDTVRTLQEDMARLGVSDSEPDESS